MNNFAIDFCPLCDKPLRLRRVSKVNIYDCPTTYEAVTANGIKQRSHYEVECDDGQCIQHVYVLPWSIDTFDKYNKSRVHKLHNGHRWKFVVELPPIHPDKKDKLKERINLLVAYL